MIDAIYFETIIYSCRTTGLLRSIFPVLEAQGGSLGEDRGVNEMVATKERINLASASDAELIAVTSGARDLTLATALLYTSEKKLVECSLRMRDVRGSTPLISIFFLLPTSQIVRLCYCTIPCLHQEKARVTILLLRRARSPTEHV